MKKIYQILPKNPSRGMRWFVLRRFGKDEDQDCYVQCRIVAKILMDDPEALILLATNFHIGHESEMAYYIRVLTLLGVNPDRIIKIHKGLETIQQMKIGAQIAKAQDAELVFIVASVHFIRVKFLAWVYRIRAKVIETAGYPRPWDVFIELIFVSIYPLYPIPPFRFIFKYLAIILRWVKKWISKGFRLTLRKYRSFRIPTSA